MGSSDGILYVSSIAIKCNKKRRTVIIQTTLKMIFQTEDFPLYRLQRNIINADGSLD